jgi:hypothetical protein
MRWHDFVVLGRWRGTNPQPRPAQQILGLYANKSITCVTEKWLALLE